MGGLAVLVLGGAGVWTFLALQPATATTRSFTRDVQAEKGTQTLTVSFEGTLAPRKQADVDFTVPGTVTKVYVKSGAKVTKGQRLARIDDGDLRNAVELAEANLATAEANLDQVYDDAGSSAAITSAKAQVRSAGAALSAAREDLADAVLRAPITGTVASLGIEVGDSVGSGSGAAAESTTGSAAVVIISTATWKVEGSVAAADLGSITAGQDVSVTTDAAADPLPGRIASVGIVADSTSAEGTAMFPVVVNLSGTHTGLYSGTTASAVITTGSYPDVLTVPTAAIRTEAGKSVVTKVDGSGTSTVTVEVGRVFGSSTEVTSGLAEGDTVRISFTPLAADTASTQTGGFGGGGFGGGGLGGFGGQPPAGPAGNR